MVELKHNSDERALDFLEHTARGRGGQSLPIMYDDSLPEPFGVIARTGSEGAWGYVYGTDLRAAVRNAIMAMYK